MASLRTGYGLPARPSDGFRNRRIVEPSHQLNQQRPLAQKENEVDVPRKQTQPASQVVGPSRLPSRVPQASTTTRRPSIPQPVGRPSLDHHSRSGGSTGSTASSRSKAHVHGASSSSSSGMSLEGNPQSTRNVLRRKKSTLSPDMSNHRKESRRSNSSSSIPQPQHFGESALGIHLDRGITTSPAEMQLPEATEVSKASTTPIIYPELDRYRDIRRPANLSQNHIDVPFKLSTHDLPPPTPGSMFFSGTSATSASPSTRFSESPGSGTYSRDTTPTSILSQSPSFAPTYKPKGRYHSPALSRPPVTRRRAGSFPNEFDNINVDPHGLAAVRESLTSSSSNSTVREVTKSMKDKQQSVKQLAPPLPSPPLRKSSENYRRPSMDNSPKRSFELRRPGIVSPESQESVHSARRHLAPSPMASPPSRPSRDGTPDIHSQLFHPVPVIHSNLSSSSLPPERRGSEPAVPSTSARNAIPAAKSRNASTSKLPLGKDGSSSSQPNLAAHTRKLSKTELPQLSRTPSPHIGTSTFNTRFPFFSRKKNSTDSSKEKEKEKEKKGNRKGPVAGTGHEGYGRLGATRRRSVSNTGLKGTASNVASKESLASNDSFLSDRMNPVVIAGGSIVGNRNVSSDLSRAESSQSPALGRPSVESRTEYEPGRTSRDAPRATLWPSAMARSPFPMDDSRRPSDSSEDHAPMKSTLAFRRSVQRLRTSPDNPLRMPQPINTVGTVSSPMTSFDTSVMSDDSIQEHQREIIRSKAPATDPAHPPPKKLVKRPRSPRKWNLFGRSNKTNELKKEENATTAFKPAEKKPFAFYTMMDTSEQEDNEPMDVQEALRSANVYENSPTLDQYSDNQNFDAFIPEIPLPAAPEPLRLPNRQAMDTARSLQIAPHQPLPVPSANLPPAPTQRTGRPSRLPQVGRIPKVVSHRDEPPPSPKIFSRPFRASFQMAPQAEELLDAEFVAKGPSPPKSPPTAVPDLTMEESTAGSATNQSSCQLSNAGLTPDLSRTEQEFLAFSPRKNSEGTIGTSCSSCSAAPVFPSATAVIPQPDDPLAEDEVWDEYNDLLGDESLRPPPSAGSSKGIPFYLEDCHPRPTPHPSHSHKPLESPTVVFDHRKISIQSKATQSSTYSADMTERIRRAFQPHPSPSFPSSVSEAVSDLEQHIEYRRSMGREEEPDDACSGSSRKERNSDSSAASSNDGSPLAQVNLRVGSMTVSKWLTFGHVMFSDVRHELVPQDDQEKRHSILVVDGLGNDDWSFYAAETYPAASFYNLSPRAPLPEEIKKSSSSFPLSPPNHHQVQYLSHADRFPFAPQSFTAMVYRFPVAAPEAHYRNILTEARRVLKPGGYLELAILDVDLNNMGPRGRRAIRNLKEKIHETTPDTSLTSTADLMVRLLGKVGFSSIKAARVGVPVAGPTTSARGSRDSKEKEAPKKKELPRLSEMMSDTSPTADEGITKMVGRVGRWWYTRCYENAAGNTNGKGVWNNRALLSECSESGTSLKLMVCCARAPDRVASL